MKIDIITVVNKDFLIRLAFPISNLYGQTYDGAINILGRK